MVVRNVGLGGGTERFNELEGLRGIAAVIVVIYHYALAFYGLAFIGSGVLHSQFELFLYGNPLGVFLSGTFSVAIFFVLSGFVLSIGFFQTKNLTIIQKLALKRYPRLMLPALASIIVVFAIMTINSGFWVYILDFAANMTHSDWLQKTWSFTPNFFSAVWSGVHDIFFYSRNGYNNVLWTMTTEFFGSFVVFGFLSLFGQLKYRWIMYAVLGVVTFNTWILAFIAGMVLADLYTSKYIMRKRRTLLWFPLLLVALFFGGYPEQGVHDTAYQWLTIGVGNINHTILYLTIGAVILVGIVLGVDQVSKLLRKKYISILGKYTFSLYLVHLPVLYTVTLSLFLVLHTQFDLRYNLAAPLAIIGSIPAVIIATVLFEKYIDSQSIRFSGWLANKVINFRASQNR